MPWPRSAWAPARICWAITRFSWTTRAARLANGTLAGSILSLDEALRNLINFAGCSLEEALPTVTTTPARAIGLDHERGRIAPGFVADLVLLSPDLRVRGTIVEGELVYHNRLDLSSEKGPILK